jgi:small subunit ribosomal protein S11
MAKAAAKTGKKKTFKKKEKKSVPAGVVHIQATFNNTIVSIADPSGNVVAWSSAGSLGFRGSRKGTPFAAQQASVTAANKVREFGMRSVEVRISGPGVRHPRAGYRRAGGAFDYGCDAGAAQRLPAAEEEARVGARHVPPGPGSPRWSRVEARRNTWHDILDRPAACAGAKG